MRTWGAAMAGGVAAALVLTSCSSGSTTTAPPATGASSTMVGSGPTTMAAPGTTAPIARQVTMAAEHEVNGLYRQGVARVDGGRIFTTNDAIARTDESYTATLTKAPALPESLTSQAFNHIGDGDVDHGVLWVPVEKDDKDEGHQAIARYDATTLTFTDSFVVPQHHASFVTVGPDGTIYSTDEFDDDTLQRYQLHGARLDRLDPLKMSQKVARIQGGDVAAGAMWLSTDDDTNGLYRVDLTTGAVQSLGSMGHADGEGEGVDATDLPSGLLHAVSADAKLVPMRIIDLAVTPSP